MMPEMPICGRRNARIGFATIRITLLVLCAAVSLTAAVAHAQSTGQGTIAGTVTDTSGSVMVGAQVSVINVQTSVAKNSVTNNTGYFEVNALNPGTYKISVESSGFVSLIRDGITLETNATLNIPLQMRAGSVAQTVVVHADASLLNTDSGSSGQVLTTKQVESIPVSGNNPTWLALIAPGVQGKVGQAASTDDTLAWTGLTTDFGNYGQIGVNEFNLDGAPNESNSRASGINPTIDELGQNNFDVTGFDPSVGHTMGVMDTQTTKLGTNGIHGTIRETYTAKRWAAMNHFQGDNYKFQLAQAGCVNGAQTNEGCRQLENKFGWPGTHMNNGSAALGGPVYIPKIINGHDKLFFFVSVLDDVFAGAGSQSATVPTLQERNGDFTDMPIPDQSQLPQALKNQWAQWCPNGEPYYGQYQIYNPYSVTLDSRGNPTRMPFCGNTIPSNLIANNKMAQTFNSLMPTPTQNNPTGTNYTYTQITPQTYRDYTFRVDYKFTQNDNLFVRYTRANYTKGQNDWTVGAAGTQQGPRWIDVPAIGWNHVFNEKTNLDITFGGTNFKTWCCYYPGWDKFKPSDLGLPTYTDQYAESANKALVEMPVLQISNYQNSVPGAPNTSLGETDNVPQTFRSFALRGNLTRVEGRHTIHAGAEYRWQNASYGVNGNVSGTYNFDDTYTQQNNGTNPLFSQSNTGLAYAAFLMGTQTSASVARNASVSLQSPYYALYAGDTFRLTPRLSIMPGIRFEYEYGVVEKHNQLIVGWDPNADLSAISGPVNAAYQSILASATPEKLAVLPQSLVMKGGPRYAGVNGAPRSQWNDSWRFLPRIGVAYQVTPKLVVRGGYGMFYDTLNALNASINQDGFSASTGATSSSTFGTNFVQGALPISDPFPATGNGSQFNAPIGAAAGALYYLGAGPTITDHNLMPSRQQRGSLGVQYQLSDSMMLDVSYGIGYTSKLQVNRNAAFTPASFYSGGTQPNIAGNALLGAPVANPFRTADLSGLAGTNPAAYNLVLSRSYYTGQTISLGNLVRPNPQYSGLSFNQSQGETHFHELLINLTRRYSNGLTLMGSLQFNYQYDRDYFANAFDPSPSWEPSNNSEPVRFTLEGVWDLPLGRNRMWANSGWESRVFGGFQLSGSYEAQPGQLVNFGNAFFVGKVSAKAIKLNHPAYHNNLGQNGNDYVQWLTPGTVTTTVDNSGVCTYSGTGFVTNSSCTPNAFNLRVFPARVNGVRQMGMNGADVNVQRTFPVWERMSLETTFNAYNVFNHQVLGGPNTNPTDSNFGRIFGDGWPNSSGRWLSIQGRLRF